jgi:ubiquinone/menaquinone biosynthesis C-methylase UbiE
MIDKKNYTARQKREIEYHEHYAKYILQKPQQISYDVVFSENRRWWNAYWVMYTRLRKEDLSQKKVLIVGCGAGEDALRIAKMGAVVYASDISKDMLQIAKDRASSENLNIQFDEMPAEDLQYEDNFFNLVIARDILHHVEIPKAMKEIQRVSKKGALFVVNEMYSHSFAEKIRRSKLVENYLYPKMRDLIYKGESPYITEDEEKLNENDIKEIKKTLVKIKYETYSYFFVTRIVPEQFSILNKLDSLLLRIVNPIAKYLAGNILFAGEIKK